MTPRMLEDMRRSCQLAADCLVAVGEMIRPGIATDEIDRFVHEYIVSHDAHPSPLQYGGGGGRPPFPKSVCTSVNDCVCHGIPGPYVLQDGDIVNVDVTTYLPREHGYHGDTSVTFYIGEPTERAIHVVETARRCLELGLAEVKHGKRIGDIGAAIQEYAEGRGCSVVRDYVGHGVGREFHMPPQIPHFGRRGKDKRMKAGMVFTIEPMINLGGYQTEVMDDDWTVLTMDRSLSAQFEHSVLVTREGCEVLTARKNVVQHSEDKPWSEVGPLSSPAAWSARQEKTG
jgi:methionyl aminopeptidase